MCLFPPSKHGNVTDSTGPTSFIVVKHPHQNIACIAVCYTDHKDTQQLFSHVVCCCPTSQCDCDCDCDCECDYACDMTVTVPVTVTMYRWRVLRQS